MNGNMKSVVVGLAVLLALALLMGALLPSTTLAGPAAQGTDTATATTGGGGGAGGSATAMASETATTGGGGGTTGGGTTLPTTGAVPAQGGSFALVIGLAGVALLGAGYALSKNAKK